MLIRYQYIDMQIYVNQPFKWISCLFTKSETKCCLLAFLMPSLKSLWFQMNIVLWLIVHFTVLLVLLTGFMINDHQSDFIHYICHVKMLLKEVIKASVDIRHLQPSLLIQTNIAKIESLLILISLSGHH